MCYTTVLKNDKWGCWEACASDGSKWICLHAYLVSIARGGWLIIYAQFIAPSPLLTTMISFSETTWWQQQWDRRSERQRSSKHIPIGRARSSLRSWKILPPLLHLILFLKGQKIYLPMSFILHHHCGLAWTTFKKRWSSPQRWGQLLPFGRKQSVTDWD